MIRNFAHSKFSSAEVALEFEFTNELTSGVFSILSFYRIYTYIYIYIYIYIYAPTSRKNRYLTLLHRSTTSSLKISNRSYNRTAPILWNNLPKSMRTFSNTSPNAATTSQSSSLSLSLSKIQFRSHLKTYLFGISYSS